MKKIIIAIDGTSSTGKSSIAKKLAAALGYTYIDTGAMYRAITLQALRNHVFGESDQVDEEKLREIMGNTTIAFLRDKKTGNACTFLNGENVEKEIRNMEVSSHVSPIAAIPFVREELVAQQQAMGRNGGIVMDGRDIGTVVFPQAEMKIFMTATPEIRAQRRFKELQEKGMPAAYEDILKNVQERDYLDTHRTISPLRPADDAFILDNSHLSFEEEMDILLEEFKKRTAI